jgi:hypothetical protein
LIKVADHVWYTYIWKRERIQALSYISLGTIAVPLGMTTGVVMWYDLSIALETVRQTQENSQTTLLKIYW